MTASTGKAATSISGITLHPEFHRLVKSGLKSFEHKKPSDRTLHMLRKKHQYLKVLIIDEISMIEREILGRSSVKSYYAKFSPFGGVSLVVAGDFYNFRLLTKKVCS